MSHLSSRWNVDKAPLEGSGRGGDGFLARVRSGLSEWYVSRRVAATVAGLLLALLLGVVLLVLRYSTAFFAWIASERDRAMGP